MKRAIRTLTIGSCGLHIPLDQFVARRFITYPFSKLGSRQIPFALSSGAAVQLYDFCVGERQLPEPVRVLAYMDKNQPTPRTREVVDRTEIVLLELSTPIEPMIGDAIVNFNRISDFVWKPLREWGVDPRIVNNFSNAVFNVRDDIEERREILLASWPAGARGDALARFTVEGLTARRVGLDEMVRDLEKLRERVQAPIALKLFDFQFMPDGRAIEWPPGFKARQTDAARRMNLSILDMAPIVRRLGVKRLVADDMKHWRGDTSALQGEVLYDFMADVLGRPRLASYPQSAVLRRELHEAFPELDESGPLIALPGVVEIPPDHAGVLPCHSKVSSPRRADSMARGAHLLPDELADRINWELIELHRRRLDAQGLDESGLGAHYEAALARELLVGRREERALEWVAWQLPPYDAYAVMRPGLGELAFLVAASGRPVIAYEPYATRRSAIDAGRAHLEAVGLLAPGSLRIVAGLTPENDLEGRVLGMGLDVAHVHTEEDAAPHFARLVRFEALLIDLRVFLKRRLKPAEQDVAVARLRDLGFVECNDYPPDFLSWFQRVDEAPLASGPLSRSPPAMV